MKNSKKLARLLVTASLFVAISGTLILTQTPIARTQSTGDYYYTDKLFGQHFSFTPKTDEVMVKFAVKAKKLDKAAAQATVASLRLETVHEAMEDHDFGVYKIPAGSTLEAVKAQLQAEASVQVVYPAMIDQEGNTRYFIPDEFTVQFQEYISEREMLEIINSYNCKIIQDHWTKGYYTLSVPPGKELFEIIREFMNLPQVKFSELSYIGFNDFAFDPNDTFYPLQWAPRNTGASGGTVDADIDAREAWDIERGDPNVIVVVIDTGVDWDHPDLRTNILQNLGEDADGDGQTIELVGGNWVLDPGDLNGIDNDGNGQTDDLIGWDFDDNDNDPNDEGNHGTSCAGIIAAVTDNAMGVAGIAHNCRIMPLRINLSAGMNQNRADAIRYAASFNGSYDGIVLSCSWKASGTVTAIRDAIVNARGQGVVICFAAGNENNSAVSFPARVEQVIAVGATSECDQRKRSSSNPLELNPGVSPDPLGVSCDGEVWWGSNFGDSLDIAAPGVHIYTTDIAGANGYDPTDYVSDFNGTSSATPFVAAAAALLLSYDHTLTPDEVQDILQTSAEKVGGYDYNHDPARPGHSLDLGYGRLNVNRALQELIARTVVTLQPEPVDIALSIDRSGSMTPPKLNAARNAAAQVVRLMNIGDRIAVTSYDHNTFVNFGIANITSEAVKNSAITTINAITAGGATSIGGGLVTAQGQFLLASPPHYPQAIILMSDGMSNTAPWVRQVTPLIPTSTDVYTIGFATSGVDISEDSLQYMAALTGGQYFFAGADGLASSSEAAGNLIAASTGGMDLIKGYQASLNIASGRDMLKLFSRKTGEGLTDTVFVDSSIDEMRFSLLLEGTPENIVFTLRSPSGRVIDPAIAAADPLIDYLQDVTLASYTVRKPEKGLWLLTARAQKISKAFISASAYSHLKGILSVEALGLGLPILVELRLIERGQPVLRANVEARLGFPNNESTAFKLFDDGQHHDGAPDDGVYANFFDRAPQGGSFTVETSASGLSNLTGDFFTRYNVASTFLPFKQDGNPVKVALPNSISLPGHPVKIPIYVNGEVFSRDIRSYAARLKFDSKILSPTGKLETKGTMSIDWSLVLTPLQPGLIEIKGSGPALQGNGILVNVLFDVVGELGQISPLEFVDFSFNGGNVPDMTMNGSFTVGSTFLERTVTLNKPKGWSLASLPVANDDQTLLGNFPKASAAFKYVPGQGYLAIDQLETCIGFWLYQTEASANRMAGLPATECHFNLPKGWSLISGLFDQPGKPRTQPENVITAMFRYDTQTGYAATDQVLPGEAVWVYCAEPCSLWLTQASTVAGAASETAYEFSWETTITAIGQAVEGAGNVSSVVIAGSSAGPSTLPAPPTVPQYTTNLQLWTLNFTAGPFARDSRMTNTPESMWVLEVDPHGNVPPPTPRSTTVSWDAATLGQALKWELREGFDGTGAVLIADMRTTTSFVVTGNSPQYFTIVYHPVITSVKEPGESGSTPTQFALHQNYPNPFNPETEIRYDLPKASRVSLNIYNVAGQLVRTLVEGAMMPGAYVVRWNGSGDHGKHVAGGVYFYSLKTENFAQQKKMIFLP